MISLKTLIHITILRPVVKLIFGINIYGREHLKGTDSYVLIANHNSHLDILLLYYILPVKQLRKTHVVAAEEYFSKSRVFYKLINYLFSPVWVRRDDPERKKNAMLRIRSVLENGENIILFPEGTRGEPGEIQPFKTGIGRLAEEYKNIPIIPVFLHGPERVLPKRYFLPMPIWNNIFISPPQLFSEKSPEITRILEKTINEISRTKQVIHHKRHRNILKIPSTVTILGIDGSGKSTISRKIAEKLSEKSTVALITDNLEFYEGGKLRELQPLVTEKVRGIVGKYAKQAKSLKMYKFPKLTEMLLRDFLMDECRKWYSPDMIILDGCPLLNLVSWAILYKEEEFNEELCLKALKILSSRDQDISRDDRIFNVFPELRSMTKLKLNRLKLPESVFLLDVDPSIAFRRIESRGEQRQVHENIDKLSKLRDAYLTTMKVVSRKMGVTAKTIDGCGTMAEILTEILEIIKSSNTEKKCFDS